MEININVEFPLFTNILVGFFLTPFYGDSQFFLVICVEPLYFNEQFNEMAKVIIVY